MMANLRTTDWSCHECTKIQIQKNKNNNNSSKNNDIDNNNKKRPLPSISTSLGSLPKIPKKVKLPKKKEKQNK